MNLKAYLYIFLSISIISPKHLLNKKKNIINLSFAINNKYTEKLLVPLVSLFDNCYENSIYYIQILVGEDFEPKNEKKLYNLEKIYFNCFINIINLGKNFNNTYRASYMDASTYYRLTLPKLCPNITRIIYLDSDSMILRDLMELYSLNFNGNYLLGKLDMFPNELDKFKIYIKNYINAGVLLMDLYSLRKYKYVDKFLNYIREHNEQKYLNSFDQTLLNYICHDKIGILNPEFHMWPIDNSLEYKKVHQNLRIPYHIIDIMNSVNNPFIVHFPGIFKYKDNKKDLLFYKDYYKYLKISENVAKYLDNNSSNCSLN